MQLTSTTDVADLDEISVAEFRARFRNWLERHYPSEWRKPIVLRLRGEQEKQWLRLLHEHGWRLPAWPREHGGMGLPLAKQLVYHEELARFGAARFLDSGGTMLGPVLIKFGAKAQQEKYLPPILRGEALWCQGYSEPNAGSDLASLKTTAVREGEHYIVNGSKIWTTMAMDASHMFLLARTQQGLRKQQGISFFLMEMNTPGVTVRPIENLAGESEFGQVFFDDARIPVENLIGVEGEGWSIAKALLGVERIFVGSPGLSRDAYAVFGQIADQLSLSGGSFDELNARLFCDLNDMVALYEMVAAAAISGAAEEQDYSLLKLASSELFQRISEANMQIASDFAGIRGPAEIGALQLELHKIYMLARAATIYSGTSEIQRDIVARSLLGKTA
jgi:alkylation response protein AidB-like acyl-CoA dehydrogenase